MPNRPTPKKKPWQQPRVAFGRRNNNNYDFYNSSRWRKKSLSYRQKHTYCECSECKELDRVRPAEVVNHNPQLQHLLDNNLDPFDDQYLESMAHRCHNKLSGRQAHGLK